MSKTFADLGYSVDSVWVDLGYSVDSFGLI